MTITGLLAMDKNKTTRSKYPGSQKWFKIWCIYPREGPLGVVNGQWPSFPALAGKLLRHNAEGRQRTAGYYGPVFVSGTGMTSLLGPCLDPDLKKPFVKCHF